MNRQNIENEVNTLLKDKSWKAPAIAGVVTLVVLALLDSVLFILVVALIKLALIIAAVALLGRAGYLAYPILLKKYKDTKSS